MSSRNWINYNIISIKCFLSTNSQGWKLGLTYCLRNTQKIQEVAKNFLHEEKGRLITFRDPKVCEHGVGVSMENTPCLSAFGSLLSSNTRPNHSASCFVDPSPSDSRRLDTWDQSNLSLAGSDARTLCQTVLVLGSASVQNRTGEQVNTLRRPKWNRAACRVQIVETRQWVMNAVGVCPQPPFRARWGQGDSRALYLGSLVKWRQGDSRSSLPGKPSQSATSRFYKRCCALAHTNQQVVRLRTTEDRSFSAFPWGLTQMR